MATAEAETSQDELGAQGESAYDGFISYSHAADDLLAPRLQSGLQRFAKPWWRRRALRIFRDEASLSANPHLWSSITDALDQSDWFVLLLSPDAADSEWVNTEVEYWLAHRDPDRIIPVLTDGEFAWADDNIVSDAAPAALHGAFPDEPRWVDLRFARTEEQLDLKNPTFSATVADIASPIRGVPKDELLSEEVRQHRRTVRTAWAAGIVVLLLGVAALVAATVAVGQSNEAQAQRDEAERQTEIALANEQRAEEQTVVAEEQATLAEQQTAIAQQNETTARSEALAAHATAQLDNDPELSVLLAAEALALDPRPAASDAMHAALQAHRTIFQVEIADDSPLNVAVGGLSPDGTMLAVVRAFSDKLEVWEVDTGDRLWDLSTADDPLKIMNAAFTPDGAELVVLMIGDFTAGNPEPAELRVFDARTGDTVRTIAAPDCTGSMFFPGVKAPFYDLSQPLVWARDLDCNLSGPTPESELGLLDPATGVFTPVLPIRATGLSIIGSPTRDAAGLLLAVDDAEGFDGRVVEVATGEIVYEFGGGIATLSADGTRLLARSDGNNPNLELWNIDTGQLLWRAGVAGSGSPFVTRAWFSGDESLVYGTGWDGSAYVLDAETGFEVFQLRGHVGTPRVAVMSFDNSRLATFAADSKARVWDIGSELLSEGPTYASPARVGGILYGGADLAEERIAIWAGGPDAVGSSDWETIVTNAATGEVELTLSGGSAALSPDGALLAYRVFEANAGQVEGDIPANAKRVGDVRIIDLDSGALIAELDTPCNAYLIDGNTVATEGCHGLEGYPEYSLGGRWSLSFSADGGLLAMTDGGDSALTVWDVATGDAVISDRIPGPGAVAMVFSPDGAFGAALYDGGGTGSALRIYELGSFAMTTEPAVPFATHGMVLTPDQSLLVTFQFDGGLTYHDTADWSIIERVQAHQGPVTGIDVNPSGTLLASTGEDGVRVWNVADRSLHTDLGFAGAGISDIEFLNDTQLLLVEVGSPSAIVVVLDPDELADAGLARVTRAFTEVECATYDIDPCPTTLEALRGG